MIDTVERYLEIIPLPVLILAPLVVLALSVLVPGRWRLSVALIVLVPWLATGRLGGLGLVAVAAKATGFVAYLLVALAAWLDPGPRRRLAPMAWLYPLTALLGFLYIWTVTDFNLALVIRLQWLMLVIAALAVGRTIVDQAALLRVLCAFTIGLVLALSLPLSDLVLHPAEAFRAGLARFFPYGANANQIGTVFVATAPLALYFALRTRRAMWKPVLITIAAIAIGLSLLTASRSVMAVLLCTLFPIGLALTRKPIVTAGAAIIVAAAIYWIFGYAERVDLERLVSLETARVETAVFYLEVIGERPLFGLLGTEGESFLREGIAAVGHPHNAYLWVLFQGGISYAIPVFVLVAYTGWCTFAVWRHRRLFGADPLLINLLAAFMFAVYAHGFVNGSILYPTYAWAFFHVLLSTFFLGLAMDLKQGAAELFGSSADDGAEHALTEYGIDQPSDATAVSVP